MAPKSSTVESWPFTTMGAVSALADGLGCAPTAPEAIWMFWLRMASLTSPGVSERPRSLSGSTQTRRERSVE